VANKKWTQSLNLSISIRGKPMATNTQALKYQTGMAGEFLVAGELNRHGKSATIMFGNAKKADVVANNNGCYITVEVKTTSKLKWVIGNSLPNISGNVVWVLVYLPVDKLEPPEYYILTNKEMCEILNNLDSVYREGYHKRKGKDYTGKPIFSVKRALVKSHKNRWDKISAN
jgi:hypothetical protein